MKRILLLFLLTSIALTAQSARGLINEGVELYNEEKFAEAESKFMDGLNEEYETFEGHFNLGDAYYKQGKFQEALKAYQSAMALAKEDKQRSKIFHNVGNTFLKDQKVQESIEAYKNALRLDPGDNETKYNLSYALKQMQQNQDQQQQNQNKDQNKNEDKQNQNQNQQQPQNQDQDKDKDQQQQQQQPQPKDQISKEEAQRILEALKNNESDLQKKLRKKNSKVIKKEKDW